ncbi:hypothetical protein ABZS83_02480 [Streptomyces sp. NPDC005426]
MPPPVPTATPPKGPDKAQQTAGRDRLAQDQLVALRKLGAVG